MTPSPSWKDSIAFPAEPFRVYPFVADAPGWVKFTILACEPGRVIFQDSNAFPFHYDFASARLDPFLGISRAAFDQATLHAAGQEAVLGAVLFSPPSVGPAPPDFGIQLVRLDPFSPEEAAALLEAVRASVRAPPGTRAFYFPSFEQQGAAEEARGFLAARGIEVSSAARWASGDACYSNGWALGTLKRFAAGEIEAAYREGRLGPKDILLTDGIPAEVPFVSGIISLVPATPNSHVAILAQSYGVPFAYVAHEEDRERAESLVGRRVVLRAYRGFESCDVRLLETEGRLDEPQIAEILALKELPSLTIAPMEPLGAYAVPVAGLRPDDIRHAGGKAVNYRLLEESIPQNSRPALAFTFDLWNAFLDRPLRTGGTLSAAIGALLAPHAAYPPPSVAALSVDLERVRDLIRDEEAAGFGAALEAAVIGALRDPGFGWDPSVRLRFRSSTNVEDSDQFTGAGLYDSFSGCLADDLDGDEAGPSLCDPSEEGERGVFRAIRRVYSSFYNDNAYLERRRWKVDESSVGMAILVHPSFPDETELANGVATVRRTGGSHEILLVTQKGAVSVTNPSDGSLPEEVTGFEFSGSMALALQRSSNLLPLGATVLVWESEYRLLAQLLLAVSGAYARDSGRSAFLLDFEYKKVGPGGTLVVKQVRRVPEPTTAATLTPFLVNEPLEYRTLQGEAGTVFSNHRLKSRWTFETRSMWLTPENLAGGLFTRIELETTDGCRSAALGGVPAELPGATYTFSGSEARHGFRLGGIANPRGYTVVTGNLPMKVAAAASPILTQRDFFGKVVEVENAEPVLVDDGSLPGSRWSRSEWMAIGPTLESQSGDLLQTRSIAGGAGVSIETSFYWPPPPRGAVAGYTAPLVRWVETSITGLTSAPIVLHGEESQTYRPGHHNFTEDFIFAPALEPGMSAAVLAELEARGVHLIRASTGFETSTVAYYDACGVGHACACAAPFRRGDCNGDGNVAGSVTDAIVLLGYLFLGGEAPPCVAACDANGDGLVLGSVTDAVYLLSYGFVGGAPPPAPFPDCGPGGPSDRALGCAMAAAACKG